MQVCNPEVISAHRQLFVSSRKWSDLTRDQRKQSANAVVRFFQGPEALLLGERTAPALQKTVRWPYILLSTRPGLAPSLRLHICMSVAITRTCHVHEERSSSLNPYVYRTKRELVKSIIAVAPDLIPKRHELLAQLPTASWRDTAAAACHVKRRRIAIEACGPDLTAYGRDLWRERIF